MENKVEEVRNAANQILRDVDSHPETALPEVTWASINRLREAVAWFDSLRDEDN